MQTASIVDVMKLNELFDDEELQVKCVTRLKLDQNILSGL